MLTRRQFLGLSGGAAITGTAAWLGLFRGGSSSHPTPASGAGDRVLVVVQMSGGNDALNTLVPLDGRYHDLRPQLGLADDKLVALPGETGFGLHPSLQPLVSLWNDHQLAIVPDIGFAADSRSHFESLDAWWTASPEHSHATGWIGRWLDASGQGADNPLVAIALGGGSVRALVSERSQSTAVNDLTAFRLTAPKGADAARLAQAYAATATPVSDRPLLAGAQDAVGATLRAVDVLGKVQDETSVEGDDPSNAKAGPISSALAAAASIIDLDLGTRVVLVSGTGFDTHANQAATQERLLDDLAKGIVSFTSTLAQRGHADRVLLVTTSEFGRRAAENGSGGTDHGHGGVHFAVGRGVHAGIHGAVDLAHLADGDLPAATDTRALYAAALDWLGGPSADVLDGHTDELHLVAA